jgi:hypothetical protein
MLRFTFIGGETVNLPITVKALLKEKRRRKEKMIAKVNTLNINIF